MSSLNTGVTIKLAPICIYKEAAAASVIEPTPSIISGSSFVVCFIKLAKTS